jgi:circadian clock protein KaiB
MNRRTAYKFQLYIAGNAPNSAQALDNLTTLCLAHLADRHEIEIIDVFKQPKRALADNILMTPTLIKVAPSPALRIVGTLTEPQIVLQTLGLNTTSQ